MITCTTRTFNSRGYSLIFGGFFKIVDNHAPPYDVHALRYSARSENNVLRTS